MTVPLREKTPEARLLALFARLGDAPDAIPRLRRFVLDLVVRGKLVEQDPEDEPAIEGMPSSIDTAPYTVPRQWRWMRIGDQLDLLNGIAFKPSDWVADGIRIVRIQNLNNPSAPFNHCVPEKARQRSLIDHGSFLISWSGTPGTSFGAFIWDRGPAVLNQHIFRCDFKTHAFDPQFLKLAINGRLDEMIEKAHGGVGLRHITKGKLEAMLIPLPHLAEQHRIVVKVDELMALCDRLEEARSRREAFRDRLTTASLARLTAPDTDAGTFRSHARFALDALPALTARADQIRTLRQTILNLAVRGKLVEQDPADEPASELLKRIAKEKERLRAEKGIRAQKPAPPAETFEAEAEIPPTWQHVYLQEIAYQITDGTHLTPKYTERGRPFLSAQNVKPFRFMPEVHRFVSQEDFEKYRSNRRPERGDILLTRVGAGIGEAAVLDSDFEFAFYVSLCLIKVPNELVNVDYLVIWLNSPEGRESSTVRTYGKGASQGNLNLGQGVRMKISSALARHGRASQSAAWRVGWRTFCPW